MSIFDRLYSARIAPSTPNWREALHNGAVVTDNGRLWRESFAPDAFLPSDKPIPVVLSHEDHRVVGHIGVRVAHRGWHICDFMLDHSIARSAIALDMLKVGTAVSIGFSPLAHDESLAGQGVKWHTRCRLDELSILRPDETPGYRGAKIVAIHELPDFPKPKPKRAPVAQRHHAGQVIYGDGRVLNRPGIGQVLGVR